MALYFDLRNPTDSDVVIDDLGVTILAGDFRPIDTISQENLSRSGDIVRLLMSDDIQLVDHRTDRVVDRVVAVRELLTGGGSVVNRDGLLRVHASPRPMDSWTNYTGAGDALVNGKWIVAGGKRLLFNMKSTDVVKQIDMVFREDVHLKDGFLIIDGAPFGAFISFQIRHPLAGPVNNFGCKIPLLRNGWMPMDTDDSGYIPAGLILRVSVHNSIENAEDGSEPPGNFKVAGRIELYRKNTLDDE